MKNRYDILFVDDEQVIIDAAVKICSAEALKVDSATDSQTALVKVQKNQYRLIICDIMLPGMDGFQCFEKVKPLGISTAFVMTTGYSTIENAVKSLYLGAIDFLPKPFTSDEFSSSVKRALKYVEIREKNALKKDDGTDNIILYVPCPARYFRLGYCSWLVKERTGSVLVGITDLFLRTVDTIERIKLLEQEQEIFQGNPCAMLETRDGLQHGILAPVSGRIIAKNNLVEEEVTLIEKDPFFKGWLYRVIPDDLNYQMKYLIPGGWEEL